MPYRSYVYWYLVAKDFLPLLTRRNNVVAVLVFRRLDGAIPRGITTRVPCITERDQLGSPQGEQVSVITDEQIHKGRKSGKGSICQKVEISVVAIVIKNKK